MIPAGPSTIDAVANAAFFYGLLVGAAEEYGDVASLMDFRDVRTNFLTAARGGLQTQLLWVDGEAVPVQELISDTLLPIAREGLAQAGIDAEDADRYLEVIGRRVKTGRTGAHWMLESLSEMKGVGSRGERLAAVTAGMFDRQVRGRPIHKWSLARLDESGGWKANYQRVEQFMTTDLFTVHEDDSVNLIANMMNWERIRHILVEDRNQRLVGLISYRSVLKYFGEQLASGDDFRSATAAQIMKRDPFTVAPEATSVEAMEIMRRHGIGCLPVETDGHLVGVVTERDFMTIANDLLLKSLKEDEEDRESKVRKLES